MRPTHRIAGEHKIRPIVAMLGIDALLITA
jgi:hypothetical protein